LTALIVSIHDVMPETLDDVEAISAELDSAGWPPATLLVVPGRGWRSRDMERLRRFAMRGHALAGHGWTHRVPRIRGLRHRLHSLLLSRRAAEHYALDELGIRTLIQRCRRWFDVNGLPAPTLYVPPAWALGRTRAARLAGLGFRYIETLSGFYDCDRHRQIRIPVLGFEADTRLRAAALRASNGINRRVARRAAAVRVSIHPADLRLRLADDLRALIARRDDGQPVTDLDEFLPAA